MTREDREFDAEVSEVDLVDQLATAHPSDEEAELEVEGVVPVSASEADWLEQQLAVPHDDEEGGDGEAL